MRDITFDNVYNAPKITLNKLVNLIEVPVYSYTPQQNASEIYTGTVAISGTEDIWIEYSPAADVTATVTGGTLLNAEYYTCAALLTISASGNVDITATGKALDTAQTVYQLRDNIPPGELPQALKVDNNLIGDTATAASVAAWLLSESKKRYVYDINWRQNPALECGDTVKIEDSYGANKRARVTRQEYSFAGALSGSTGAKG